MILRFPALWRPAVSITVGVAALLAFSRPLDAHEIPARAALIAFVKPGPGWLRIVLRAPLESMRDVTWPDKGLGYMDLPKSMPLARDAANQWIVDFIQVFENGAPLKGNLAVVR